MAKPYRLEPLLRVKARAKRQSEIVLGKRIGALAREKKKKEELEEQKANLLKEKKTLRQDFEKRLLSQNSQVNDSRRFLDFLKKLDEDVLSKDREIERQDEAIADAEIRVQRARRDYQVAAHEHQVMEKHRELWHKRQLKELERREQKTLDELGQVIHQMTQAS